MIYAPGNSARLLEKVFQTEADSVILDLEDAVPRTEKARAREMVARAIDEHRNYERPIFVRVNASSQSEMLEDIAAVVAPGLTGIKIPKVGTPTQVRVADACISDLEGRRGLAPASIRLTATIEGAAGLHNVLEIGTASDRMWCLSFGAVDFALDTNSEMTANGDEALLARSQIVVASRVAGLAPPFDSVYPMLDDDDGLLRSARASRRLGFQGKSVIHPKQIAPVHSVYTPSDAEIAQSRRIVSAFERAEATGRAAFMLDGVMVDYAILHRAENLLSLARRLHLEQEHPGVTRADTLAHP